MEEILTKYGFKSIVEVPDDVWQWLRFNTPPNNLFAYIQPDGVSTIIKIGDWGYIKKQ